MISFPRRLGAAAGLALVFSGAARAQLAAPDCAAALPGPPHLPATIPIELHSNHVTFWVCRGNKPLMFVLDTGAGQSILDLGVAKSLGAKLNSPFRATGAGAGSVEASRMEPDSVVLPGASVVAPIVTAIDLASVAGPEGGNMQGILGADFISRYIVALDYVHMQMRLYDRATFTYDGPGVIVPFQLVGAFIHVRATVGITDSSSAAGDFVVDVGSSLALALAKPFVDRNQLRDRVGPTVRRPSGRGVGGAAVADVARVASLRISQVDVERPIAYLYGDSAGVFSSSSAGDGNIGGDILRRYTVFFDYAARRMIWEPNENVNVPFEADMSGLQLAVNRGGPGFTVDFVVPNSPAGELGFKRGDQVMAVDGKTAAPELLDALRVRMRRAGERIQFTVKRGMTPMVFDLVTRRLV